MRPYQYHSIMRQSKDPGHIRFKMVMEAGKNGVKPAARLFRTTPDTVRRWLRRFDDTPNSLRDESRAPKLSAQAEEEMAREEIREKSRLRARLSRPKHSTGVRDV